MRIIVDKMTFEVDGNSFSYDASTQTLRVYNHVGKVQPIEIPKSEKIYKPTKAVVPNQDDTKKDKARKEILKMLRENEFSRVTSQAITLKILGIGAEEKEKMWLKKVLDEMIEEKKIGVDLEAKRRTYVLR
jgi:hypothetical protein